MPATPRLSTRVIARLAQAEACESNPHLADDLRIARLTVHYAASGEALLCSPDVLASYMVLGLHPEKVWPAIRARRDAIGSLYGPVCSEVRRAPSVPKKPAHVVSLWFEKTNAARATNPRGGETLLRDNTISVPMAAPSIAAGYPNPDDSQSVNSRQFFTVAELEEFFETCPAEILPECERRSLHGMWLAVGTALGKKPCGARIQFFLSVQHYAKGARYRSCSALRYNLRRLESRGAIVVDYRDAFGKTHHLWVRPRTDTDKGDYRRVPSYSLSIPLLLKWREWKRQQGRLAEMPKRKPARPAPDHTPDPPLKDAPNPEPARKVAEAEPKQTELTDRQRSRLRRRVQAIVRDWRHGSGARVGSSDGELLFIDVVRQACDDEFIEFDLAWPWIRKLWWRNQHGWRKASRLEGEEGS